jgi:hypothetical protein
LRESRLTEWRKCDGDFCAGDHYEIKKEYSGEPDSVSVGLPSPYGIIWDSQAHWKDGLLRGGKVTLTHGSLSHQFDIIGNNDHALLVDDGSALSGFAYADPYVIVKTYTCHPDAQGNVVAVTLGGNTNFWDGGLTGVNCVDYRLRYHGSFRFSGKPFQRTGRHLP